MRGERGRKEEKGGGIEEKTERGTEKGKYSLKHTHTHTHTHTGQVISKPTVDTITSSAGSY